MNDTDVIIQIMISAVALGDEDPKRILKRARRAAEVMAEAGLISQSMVEPKKEEHALT